jgi:signal transduction histidine kinase
VTGADREVVRVAERRVALTVGAAVLLVVAVVAALAWVAGRAEGREQVHAEAGAEQSADRTVATGLGAVLLVGAVSAGAVGLVAARRAVRPVQEALAAQRRFVADASHELRTPLAVVHTRAELLLARTPPDDARHRVTAQLVEDTRGLGEVVTDLLVSAQMEDAPVPREPVEVVSLLRAVADSFEAVSGTGVLAVAGDPVVVQAAPAALRRAVGCLVDNALAHSPDGGRVVLAVVPDAARGTVAISVSDEGEGFPRSPEDRRRLTERFERGGRSPRLAPGPAGRGRPRFGLGLALVREVAERHGGRLVLGDRDGGGAVATIELPAR